jgi:acyl dehydratase
MRYLEDLELGQMIDCGSFRLSRDKIVTFAQCYDPQPFHLDEDAARASYFGGLCASGLHSQGAAIGLMVRALQGTAFVAGYSLHEARFYAAVRPDAEYRVRVSWADVSPSPRDAGRGRASITGEARDGEGALVMTFGVTYVVARRPAG